MSKTSRAAFALILVLALTSPAVAQAPDGDGWKVTVAPYFLGTSMSGTAAVKGQEVTVDMSPSDIFGNLQFGAMGVRRRAQGRLGRRRRRHLDVARRERDEQSLSRFHVPTGLADRRRLSVFRDADDLTGPEYRSAIEAQLAVSRKLVLVCSPNARASAAVNDEVRRFTRLRGAEHIVSILLAGSPDEEEATRLGAPLAFPPALLEALAVPLVSDFRAFRGPRDRVDRGLHYGAWYTLLANVLEQSREQVEERDQRAKRRRARQWGAGVSVVIAALMVLSAWALRERSRAIAENAISNARRLAAAARSTG